MLQAIKYNLSRLMDFSDRESRALFWPYAGFVFALSCAALVAIIVPTVLQSISRMQEFAAANPDLATVTSGPGHYSITIEGSHPELMPDMQPLFVLMGFWFLACILLLAAGVTRRLHDTGRRGFWGLMPMPFIAYTMIVMPRVIGRVGDLDFGLFFSVFLSNSLYMVSLVFLVIFLAGKGSAEANQFGELPGPRT